MLNLHNWANTKSRSRVSGEALVVFLKNGVQVEVLQLKDFRAIQTAKDGFAKHGPVSMLVKQKGELWRYFNWKNKASGTTYRRASLNVLSDDKISPELKMMSMIGEWE